MRNSSAILRREGRSSSATACNSSIETGSRQIPDLPLRRLDPHELPEGGQVSPRLLADVETPHRGQDAVDQPAEELALLDPQVGLGEDAPAPAVSSSPICGAASPCDWSRDRRPSRPDVGLQGIDQVLEAEGLEALAPQVRQPLAQAPDHLLLPLAAQGDQVRQQLVVPARHQGGDPFQRRRRAPACRRRRRSSGPCRCGPARPRRARCSSPAASAALTADRSTSNTCEPTGSCSFWRSCRKWRMFEEDQAVDVRLHLELRLQAAQAQDEDVGVALRQQLLQGCPPPTLSQP